MKRLCSERFVFGLIDFYQNNAAYKACEKCPCVADCRAAFLLLFDVLKNSEPADLEARV